MESGQEDGGAKQLDELDSVELVARAKGGEFECAEALFRRYRPRLLRLARRAMGRGQFSYEPSDIVQSTLRRAVVQWQDFEPEHERAIAGWFSVILKNTIVSVQRREGAAKRGNGVDPGELDENAGQFDAQHSRDSLLENLADDELAARVWSSLSAEDLELVRPRLEQVKPWEEVAESAGISSAECARKKYSRLLSRLKQELSQEDS